MCGRYYIEFDEEALQGIAGEIEKKIEDYPGQITIKTGGEIFPADIVPVQTGINRYEAMKWGFVSFTGKPLINARSETAFEKPMFREAMRERRCLIPASGYYEWSKERGKKTKFRFHLPDQPMYFAGCYRKERSNPLYHFVILTQEATNGIKVIHHRMPVIIRPEHFDLWLHDGRRAMEYAAQDLLYEGA